MYASFPEKRNAKLEKNYNLEACVIGNTIVLTFMPKQDQKR